MSSRAEIRRQKAVERPIRVFTARRIVVEGVSSGAQAVATAVIPDWAVLALDGVSSLLSARLASSARRRLRTLEHTPPKVPDTIGLEALNVILPETPMMGEVDKWEAKQVASLKQRELESRKKERAEIVHRWVHTAVVGISRTAFLLIENIPHSGSVLSALGPTISVIAANPNVLIPAAIAVASNPWALVLIGTAFASAFIASRSLSKLQKALTHRLKVDEPRLVKAAADRERARSRDDVRSPLEQIADSVMPHVARLFGNISRRIGEMRKSI